MANVPPPKGKGEPPPPELTVGNLDKWEREPFVALNFKVPALFKREFKIYAAAQGKSMSLMLQETFALLKNDSTK